MSKDVTFEKALIKALERLGVSVVPQFRVPGTSLRVDVYIAYPARAFVELNLHQYPSALDAQNILQRLKHLQSQFAGEILPILVAHGETRDSASRSPALEAAGFKIIISKGANEDSASSVAEETWNLLARLPYRFQVPVLDFEDLFESLNARIKKAESDTTEARPSNVVTWQGAYVILLPFLL